MSSDFSFSDSSESEDNTPIKPKRSTKRWVAPSSSDDDSSDECIVRNAKNSRRPRVSSTSSSSDSSVAGPSKKKLCRTFVDSDDSDSSLSSGSIIAQKSYPKEVSGRKNMIVSDSDCSEIEVEKIAEIFKNQNKKEDGNDSSDNDGEEKCIICFKALGIPVAKPSNCNHTFHTSCLMTWSKTSNTCPIDRVKYSAVFICGASGSVMSRRRVSTPPPQDHNSFLEPDDPTFCEVCDQHDRESEMLLCDRCEAGYHLDCLTPPLSEVPSGDWFCPDCSILNHIDPQEVRDILNSAVILQTRFRRRPEVETPRIVPRTRAAQRVLNTIRQRANAQPSTSGTSTSRQSTSRRKKSRRKTTSSGSSSKYKVELVTTADGDTVEVKLAIHTGRSKKKAKSKRKMRKTRNTGNSRHTRKQRFEHANVRESSRVSTSNNLTTQPLDLFGSRPQLDYFSGCEAEDEFEEEGGLGLLRRRGRTVGARAMAERKFIAAQLLASGPPRPRPVVASQSTPATDILSSILQEQERMYSPCPQNSSQNSSPEHKPKVLPTRSEALPVRKAPGSNSTNHNQGGGNTESRNMEGSNQYYRGTVTSYHSAPPLQPPPQPPFSRLYEDEDIDLYADIEPPTCRLTTGSLVPPPEPPALLLAMEEDGGSSPEDTMLVIDDQREAYDPDEPTSPPSPDKAKDGGGTSCKSPAAGEDTKDYSKVNINLEDIRLPSPVDNENDSECPNMVMYSKASRSIARRDSSDSASSVQGEIENGVSTCCTEKESTGERKLSANDESTKEDPVADKKDEVDQLKNDDNDQDNPSDEAEVDGGIVSENKSDDVENENVDKQVKNEESGAAPEKCDIDKNICQEDNSESEEPKNIEVRGDNETSDTDLPQKKDISDEMDDDDTKYAEDDNNTSERLSEENHSVDKKKTAEDEKQDSSEKIDLMEDTSLGEESEVLNESQISGENIEVEEENKTRSSDLNDDKDEDNDDSDNDSGDDDDDNENDNEKDPEGDVLVLGCEEGDRDGLVDITDEEMSTYEKNWEMEKDKSGDEKRVGLEGLETEAISECEDTLYDDAPVKTPAENSIGKEEGEIIAEEKVESVAWKKISKGTKERSYREKDSKEKNKENKKKEKKPKEKRKEMERYDVRKIISDKPKKRKTDEFGRDISNSRSRSTSRRSDSRVKRRRSSRDRRKSHSRGRTKSRSKSRARGRSRGKSLSPSKSRQRGRSWSRTRGRSRPRSRARSRSRSKRRLRSRSLRRDKPRERMKSKDRKRRRKSTSSCSSCSCSSCEREKRSTKKLAVVLPNKKPSTARKGKTKKRDKTKDKSRKDPNRRRKAGSPVPSKEVFTSGDNILVSVNFKSSKSGDGTRKKDGSRRKREDESRRRKDKSSKENQPMRSIVTTTVSVPPNMPRPKRKNKLNVRNLKPVAIIDLDQSPFREQTPSPKEVIILSDSDSEDKRENEAQAIQAVSTGPKTPPEPHIKFIINPKPPLRNLSNPLLDSAEPEEREGDEEESQEMSHKGPNTPPEPPVPYDPFEPTKSRSPTPGPDTDVDRLPSPVPESVMNRSPEQPKSASPPKMIIQHESPKTPSPLQSPPPKPPEEVVVEKPKLPVYTPVMTTNCSDDGVDVSVVVGSGTGVVVGGTATVVAATTAAPGGAGAGGGGGDSPYSPGSSEGDDLFEPPMPQITSQTPVAKVKPRPIVPQKHTNTLKLTPSPLKKKPAKATKNKGASKKEIGIKLDEDQLKILDDLPNSAVEMQVKDKFLKKLNRQERVVEEVKLVLKPHYAKKHINKEEYKEILRKAVPKICHSRSGEINPIKIQHLIEAYVKKYRHKKKKTMVGGILPLKPKQKQSMWC